MDKFTLDLNLALEKIGVNTINNYENELYALGISRYRQGIQFLVRNINDDDERIDSTSREISTK